MESAPRWGLAAGVLAVVLRCTPHGTPPPSPPLESSRPTPEAPSPARDGSAAAETPETTDSGPEPEADVVAPAYFVEQLKLIGVVSGRAALFVDPEQKGWTVREGSLVGRGDERSCWERWRVEVIREAAVTLVRLPRKSCAGDPVRRTLTLAPNGTP